LPILVFRFFFVPAPMLALPTDPLFYAFAVPAVLLAGVSKAGFGGATGGLAVVLITQATQSPATAAAIMLPLLCGIDLFGVKAYWTRIDWSLLKRMLPAAIIGTIIGALTWRHLSVPGLKAMLGTIAIAFPLQWWWKDWRASRANATTRVAESNRADFVRALAWCGLAGFTSFVAHAGGPPVLAYLMPKKMDKSLQVGTMSFFFLIVNYAKLPQYIAVGQFTPQVLGSSLVLAPFIPLGVWLGLKLHAKLSQKAFQQTCYVLMLVMGSKLLLESIPKLIG
jgi:uncharacterized protein